MLFSEEKERQNRFLLSLKITFPLVLVIGLSLFLLIQKDKFEFEFEDKILFVILIVCYVYYIVYLIYFAFKNSVLDPITKAFNREYITKLIIKKLKKNREFNIFLISFDNIQDINNRYGYNNADLILLKFVNELSKFMKEKGLVRVPIGKYSGGNFLFITNEKIGKVTHLLKEFESRLFRDGIDGVEVKISYSGISSNFDKNFQNIINTLFLKLQGDKDIIKVLKPDYFNELVYYSIGNKDFNIKYNLIKNLKANDDLIELNIKLYSKELGLVSKNKILYAAKTNNYEVTYDIQVIAYLCDILDFSKLKSKIILEISPVSLRSTLFQNSIELLISDKKLDPTKIIFEFWEENLYHEMNRFGEIIDKFKNLGFEIALSHFGGDNAGYIYIKYLNLDYVIYDMEINKTIGDEKICTIFLGYEKLLKDIGIKTIVKFIDKKNLYEKFKNLGVDYIQGFYLDKPKDIKHLKEENALW
ncbi:EAL domain-containing protein [uncultured Campylobacter sp.]|uniref:EAL domain-containing protein n=1 Tax=uncultured Campylobacter sp. TaxID=218934 RepID=UPI002609EBB4|nr:EAL domain-containing protein [uncultured Campylobacter sp.]